MECYISVKKTIENQTKSDLNWDEKTIVINTMHIIIIYIQHTYTIWKSKIQHIN